MKRVLATLTACLFFLAIAVGPAVAKHKPGHHRPPACEKSKAELVDKEKDKKKKGKKNKKRKGNKNKDKRNPNEKNKHCYPPTSSPTSSGGTKASFGAPAPERSGGITVGVATIAAVGALGALLVFRRRWVFRTARRS